MKIQLKNLFLYNFHIDVLVYGYICKMAMNITFNHHTINKCTLWHLFQRNKGMLHTRTPVHKRLRQLYTNYHKTGNKSDFLQWVNG